MRAAQEKETAEMMDKLKGLGNTILGTSLPREINSTIQDTVIYFLGKFGLSTDNFKFEPNGQGGYSMNFAR